MIKMPIATAFMFYLSFGLVSLLIIWVRTWWRQRNKTVLPPRVQLFQCEYCHHTYVADSLKRITTCPQCQSFNKHDS